MAAPYLGAMSQPIAREAVPIVSFLANPTYTFASAGTKTVTLIVFDPHGDQVRVARTITVT